jgi:hypothetical protein
MEEKDYASSSAFIHIQVTVDTDELLSLYKGKLSQNPNDPTMVNKKLIYAVVSTNASIEGHQGTTDLKFLANKDDKVRVYGTSEYGNMDNPILVYKIAKLGSGPDILTDFASNKTEKMAVQPCNRTPSDPKEKVLPPVFKNMDFWYYEANVSATGDENFTFWFAIYERLRTQKNPNLLGYFKWDPAIHVDY